MKLLQNIDSPADLRKLNIDQLPDVADDIRQHILETMSRVGGHTGASLGAIELAVALHYAFDTPHDRLVWDVGHQAYAHKILTGRRDLLSTVKQYGGKYIVRGGACETLEGDWKPKRIVVLQFDNMERAQAWLNSPEYIEPRKTRHRTAKTRMILVEGL